MKGKSHSYPIGKQNPAINLFNNKSDQSSPLLTISFSYILSILERGHILRAGQNGNGSVDAEGVRDTLRHQLHLVAVHQEHDLQRWW